MPFVNRFFQNARGGATFTGNTLGLSRSEMVGTPGTVDSIGAFVTTNTALTFGTYPAGTTGNFLLNNSSAVLTLPPGATILYAELIWGGTYINNGVDLSAFINNAVGLQTPTGTFSVAPDPNTAFQVLLSTGTLAYARSADVTSLVSAGGAGTYTTSGVVGTIVIPDPTSNHAGWTLAVYYQDLLAPLRNLSLRVGATVIQATSGPVNTVINGFATPFSGALNGRALVGAQEGDANKSGDQMLFGPTMGSLTILSGPNNFANNFFASQINKDNGTLDTTGTFGTRNQNNGSPGSNIIGGRQGWDITNVSISSTLLFAQTSAIFRLTTNGDGYLVDSVGIQIDIQEPILSVVKSTPTIATIVGDVVNYTLSVKNNGMVDATNVVVFDNAIDGTTLVPGSVKVNGVTVSDSPVTGVPVGTISPGVTVTVMYSLNVVAVPLPPILKNQAQAAFDFMATPDTPPISIVAPSNIIEIPVFFPIIVVKKEADLPTALVGDIITYTLTVKDIGNIDATAIINDPLPLGASFIPNSVFVDGVNLPGSNPNVGIDIGVVDLIQTVTIMYKLLVTAIPPGGIIHNEFTTAFKIVLPDHRVIPGSVISNPVDIPVSSPVVTPVKSANLPSALVGDVITYSVNVTNSTPAPVTNVSLTDNIPAGTSFVTGSVTVGGVPNAAADPVGGIPIGVLAANTSILVTFQLRVDSVPDPAELVDQAKVTFTNGGVTESSYSNEVTIPVVQPGISLVKRSNVQFANVGDTINYSVTVTNTGNIAIDAVVFDPLNTSSAFVPGTVLIDGIAAPAVSPLTGIPVGTIAPGGVVLVSYNVVTTAVPPSLFYEDQANAPFTFTPPGRPPAASAGASNIVLVENPQFLVNIVKSVSTDNAMVNDRITYTLEVRNFGPGDVTNVVVSDSASPGGQFVPGSVAVNGVLVPGGNIGTGVNIGTIPAGATVTVTFDVIVVFDPEPDGFINNVSIVTFTDGGGPQTVPSNPVSVKVTQPVLTAVKAALVPFAFVGQTIEYTTEVSNTSHFNAVATWFDIVPPGTEFVKNSVTLNRFPVPGANMLTGLLLGTVEAMTTGLVTFLLRVVSYPPTGVVTNQGNILLEFTTPDGRSFTERVFTNPVTVPIIAPPSIVKSASVGELFVGDSVVFTVVVSNPGNTPFDHAVLRDIVPPGLVFVPGSLTVGGAASPSGNPAIGVPLGFIGPGNSIRVTFAARADREPDNPITVNTASLTFEYIAPDGTRVPSEAISNPVSVIIAEHEE